MTRRRWLIPLLLVAGSTCLLWGATIKLYLKDGSFQLIREYQVQQDRVRFYSIDRDEWEEVPRDLIDLDKTVAEAKAHEEDIKKTAAANAAEEKAERDAANEIAKVPQELGVYLIEDDKLTPIKSAESKIVTDKKRTVLRVMSPLPLVSGKATVELDGPHATVGTANREPQFYIRLSEEERFGLIRMGEHKGNRVVEKLTIVPVSKENIEEPDLVDTFRQQVGDLFFKIWPEKPLAPGEYALIEYTEGKVNMQVWDFFVAPGVGK